MSPLTPRPELEPDFRDYEPIHPQPGWRSLAKKLWGPSAVVLGLAVKFSVFAFKFLGLFVSVAAYALIWGWKFGVGFVALILDPRAGPLRRGKAPGPLDVSIPRFIPFLGAYVAIKQLAAQPAEQRLPWRSPGPAAGEPRLARRAGRIGLVRPARRSSTRSRSRGFFLNLFNLIPIGILDGGAIWRSYRLAKSEPMVPLEAGGAAVLLPGAGRANATLILTLYIGLAVLLALGMWGTHVPQHRL